VISGMALNIIVAGLGPTLADAWFGQAGRVPVTAADGRFRPIDLPFAQSLDGVPVLGPLYVEVLSGHNILVYIAALAVPAVAWVVYRTRFGLRLRAVGENPAAVDVAGISVVAMRYRALLVTGALCGIAGTYLSIAQSSGYLRDMTAGKGYLALAALIFGKWRPVPAVLACLLFAFADAVQARLQGVALPFLGQVPTQAIQALPYLITIVLLAGFVGRAVPPRALGVPYVKER
jgi:simple sugar transport system permease protein